MPPNRYDRRAGGRWSEETDAGIVINEDNVVSIDTVLACVRVLSESMASLPLEYCLKTDDGGSTPVYDDPLFTLIRYQPNPEMTSYELRYGMMWDSILRGYGAAQIVKTVKGRPMQLWPLYARNLRAGRAPDDNRLVFLYANNWSASTKAGNEVVLLEADEVLIIKSMPNGGLLGSSLVRLAASALGDAKAADDFAQEFFKNGESHSGTIEVPDELGDEAYKRLKTEWKEAHAGKGQRHKVVILEGDAKFNPLALNAEETQLLETRKYKRSTIAGLFRVPAQFINDLEKATFSNVESIDLSFVKHSLRPWLTNWEQRLWMSLLNGGQQRAGYYFCHDLLDMLRGEVATRFAAYMSAVNCGILSPNDCRKRENLAPYKGGDTYLVQGALRDINSPPVPATAPTATSKTKTQAEIDAHPLLQ